MGKVEDKPRVEDEPRDIDRWIADGRELSDEEESTILFVNEKTVDIFFECNTSDPASIIEFISNKLKELFNIVLDADSVRDIMKNTGFIKKKNELLTDLITRYITEKGKVSSDSLTMGDLLKMIREDENHDFYQWLKNKVMSKIVE